MRRVSLVPISLAAIGLMAVLPAAPPVAAANIVTLTKQLHTVHQKLQSEQSQAAKLHAGAVALESQLNGLNQRIHSVQQSIGATTGKIDQAEQKIAATNQNLTQERQAITTQTQQFNSVLLFSEENGTVNYLSVLLNVHSFGDFVARLTMLGQVSHFQKSVLAQMAATKQKIESDLTALDQTRATLDAQKQHLVALQDRLQTTTTQQHHVLLSVRAQQRQVNQIVASLRVQGQKLSETIKKIEAELAAGKITRAELLPIVKEIAKIYNVDPLLVMAVIQEESGGYSRAKSSAGAEGLMQLMPGTARELGVTNAYNPLQNVRGGITYLHYLLQKFHNNIALALAAYNAGPNAVIKYGGIPPYPETQRYVRNILYMYHHGL